MYTHIDKGDIAPPLSKSRGSLNIRLHRDITGRMWFGWTRFELKYLGILIKFSATKTFLIGTVYIFFVSFQNVINKPIL